MTEYSYLVSGSYDKTVRIWDLKSFECIKILEGHTTDILSVTCDAKYLYSSSSLGDIIVWSLDSFEKVTQFKTNNKSSSNYLVTDGQFLYSTLNMQKYIQKWSVNNWEDSQLIECDGLPCGLLVDDNNIYTLAWPNFTVIDKKSHQILSKLFLEEKDMYSFSIDEDYIYTGDSVFSRKDGSKVADLGAFLFEIHFVENDEDYVYWSSYDVDNISVWKKYDWKMIKKLGVDPIDRFEGLLVLQDMVIGGGPSRIYIWEKFSWELITILRGHYYLVSCLAVF